MTKIQLMLLKWKEIMKSILLKEIEIHLSTFLNLLTTSISFNLFYNLKCRYMRHFLF